MRRYYEGPEQGFLMDIAYDFRHGISCERVDLEHLLYWSRRGTGPDGQYILTHEEHLKLVRLLTVTRNSGILVK